ncbi:MAG: hypothetical protein AAF329_01175 [Cyanobacteria bacterium P01_A01_bin.17]
MGSAVAQTLTIPTAQQKPPATLEDRYPYRPACVQLIPQVSKTNPDFIAWGPVIGGKQQIWYGLPALMSLQKAQEQLAALGLCVAGGEVVPFTPVDFDTASTATTDQLLTDDPRSPLERNLENLRNAPNDPNNDESGNVFFVLLLAAGMYVLYDRYTERRDTAHQTRDRDREPDRRHGDRHPFSFDSPYSLSTRHENDAAATTDGVIPDRVSPEDLVAIQLGQQPEPVKKRTALDVLCASPFVSRAIYGAQRSGKSNFVASAAKALKTARGVEFFVINLSSYGSEDTAYWSEATAVLGDLVAISEPEEATALINRAVALVDDFMNHPTPAILVCDEWTFMGAKHGTHGELLAPLLKDLANKIAGFASSGMKRRKGLWAISPTIVAGELEDFAKSVKKLSPCLVAIAPGHAEQWDGDELAFSRELYNQVATNYPGALAEPPDTSASSRIACINGEWLALGTKALVAAAIADSSEVVETMPVVFPKPLPLSPALELFRDWLGKKVGEVIDHNAFKNANCFRQISRSKESYLMLCDKAMIKGWLSQQGEETFFVLGWTTHHETAQQYHAPQQR